MNCVHNENQQAHDFQRLPFLAFFLVFFDAMVGSNSSWGQAPLMEPLFVS